MIRFKNLKNLSGIPEDLFVVSDQEKTIDASHLTALPALIDPHVHFRVPGGEHKEDWKTGAAAAISGGVTTVFDMPNNNPACSTYDRLVAKKAQIDAQLLEAGIPLRYGLYFGADKGHVDEFEKVKGKAVGVKVFMGCSTGDLLVDTDEALEVVFKRATDAGMLIAVHAEDEEMLKKQKALYGAVSDPLLHSQIRCREAASKAVSKAIDLAARFGSKLYVLHMSTKEELELIRAAKKSGVNVFAEVTPHHLFLSVADYAKWGCFVQMNPPLRDAEDQAALWSGLRDGTIDTIGTDHAPHTKEEKQLPYGKAPSGITGVETSLPLMLDAVSKGQLSLSKLVELTSTNILKMFGLEKTGDLVLVDLNKSKILEEKDLRTKCGWSPYIGRELKGWPIYTVLRGKAYPASGLS